MQSISGFSPAPQAVSMNARASVANKNRNLFAGGHTDFFQGSQPSVKFAGLKRTPDNTYVDGEDRRKYLLSAHALNVNAVPHPRTGRMHEADGAEYRDLKEIRNDRNLSDDEKIAAIEELFKQASK